MNPARDWNSLWFDERPTLAVGLFRFVFGSLLLADLVTLWPDIPMWFSDRGLVSARGSWLYEGWDHFSLLYSVHSPAGAYLFFTLYVVIVVLFTLGLGTRVVRFLLYIMLISWHHRAMYITCGMDIYNAPMAFLFLFAPCDRSFSLDSVLRKMRRRAAGETADPPETAPFWGQRMMQFQVSLVYAFAVLQKIQEEPWRDGTTVYYLQHLVDFYQLPFPGLSSSILAVNVATHVTLAIQMSLAFLVWVPALRYYVLIFGFTEHLIMMWNINLIIFQAFLMSGFLVFVESSTVGWWLETLQRWFRSRRPALFVYDAGCAACRAVASGVESLDFFGKVRSTDVRNRSELMAYLRDGRLPAPGDEPRIIDCEGRTFAGGDAFLWLSWRLPLFLWCAPVLSLPGVGWAVRRACRWLCRRCLFLAPEPSSACPGRC